MAQKPPKPQVGSATPPPKKPPPSQTATQTPPEEPPKKPPFGIGTTSPESDRFAGRSAAQKIINRRLSTVSDKDLIAAFRADPLYVLRKLNYFKSLPHQRRLDRLIQQNPQLKPLFERTLSRLAPQPLTQPSPKAKPKAPPKVTPEDLIKPLPKTNEINHTNKAAIERWLNQLKPEFQAYLAKRGEATKQARDFSSRLWSFLSLYRGRIVGHYLSEASWSLLFSALGPLGNMMDLAHRKNYSWKMAWQKNLLNPNAIYYYFNALPVQKAFEVLKYPLTTGFSILAKGGAPLISTVHFTDQKFDPKKGFVSEIKQKNVFTPLLAAIQTGNYLGDKIYQEKSPQYFHQVFNQNLKAFEQAKKNYLSSRTVGDQNTRKKAKQKYQTANQNLDQLLNIYSGNITGKPRQALLDISKSLRRNLRRNLKSAGRRDPISFLAILVGQLAFDFAVGLALNTLRLVATKVISLVPGVNALRARLAGFLTSKPWLQNMKYAGATGPAFVKGVFSLTTLSSGYLGYQLGGPVLAPITGGLGALYQTSLHLAKNPVFIDWVKNFQSLQSLAKSPHPIALAESPYANLGALDEMAKLYGEWKPSSLKIGGWAVKPGPLARFANFLNKNWLVRLPLNGLALGHLLSPIFEEAFGWSPLQTTLTLAGADYFWQIKGNLTNALMKKWLQPRWKVLGRSIATPHWRLFSLNNPGSLFSKTYSRYIQRGWRAIAKNLTMFPHERLYWADKPWLSNLKKSFNFAKPYLQNFFNPGLFLGLGLGPWLASFGVPLIPAYFAGALIGTTAWWSAGLIYQALAGSKAISFPKLTASSWMGYFTGLGLQLVLGLFGFSAPWLPLALSIAFPVLPILATFVTSPGFLGVIGRTASSLLAGLTTLSPLVAGLMTLSFYLAMASVVVGVFYVAFTVISAMWQPFSSSAVGASECFEIELTADKTIVNPGDLVTTCATYTVLPNPLLLNLPHLDLIINADFRETWDYHTHLKGDMSAGVKAWRQRPNQSMQSLLNPDVLKNYVLKYNNYFFIAEYPAFFQTSLGHNYMKVLLSVLGDDDPSTGWHYGGKTIAELAQEFSSLQNIPSTAIDKQRQIEILEAQVKTTEKQSQILNTLLSDLNFTLTNLNQPNPNNISSELQAFQDNFVTLLTLDITDPDHPFYDQILAAQAQLSSCGSDQSCRNHFNQLIRTYQSWQKNIKGVSGLIQILIFGAVDAEKANPTSPDYSKIKADFETLVYTTIPTILDSLETILDNLKSAIDQIDQIDLTQEFYYVEGNTVYKVCWQAVYRGEAGEVSIQRAEIVANQAGGWITQPYCQTQNTIIFNP